MARPDARAQVEATVRSVLGGLHGVEVDEIEATPTTRRTWSVVVRGSAWGPGLHAMPVTWTADVGRHRATSMPILRVTSLGKLNGAVRRAFADVIATQIARSTRALSHAILSPLPLSTAAQAASAPNSMRIEHLLVDRMALHRLVEAGIRTHGGDGVPRASLDRQIAFDAASAYETDLQGPTVDAGESVRDDGMIVRGVNVLRKLPVMLREVRTATGYGTESLLQAHFAFGPDEGVKATFDGSHLILLAPLPETALAASLGHRIGDIVETGTPIDAREILSATTIGSATVIQTRPDLVRVSDLPRETVTRADIEAMDAVPTSDTA